MGASVKPIADTDTRDTYTAYKDGRSTPLQRRSATCGCIRVLRLDLASVVEQGGDPASDFLHVLASGRPSTCLGGFQGRVSQMSCGCLTWANASSAVWMARFIPCISRPC